MYFCIDEGCFTAMQDLVYQPFYADFGPLSLGKTWKYITELEKLLAQENLKKTHLYHYTSTDSAKCANAAYLMGAFQVHSESRRSWCSSDPLRMPSSPLNT